MEIYRQLGRRRGSALLAVLWVSAALAAVAFSLSNTVLGETERTSTGMDGLRSEYLATGAIWRAADEMLWSRQTPDPHSAGPRWGAPFADYAFPSGGVHVDIIPETAKLNVNLAPPEQLYRLLAALGLDATRARDLALAIVAARSRPLGPPNLALPSSFGLSGASFQEIEDLLLVQGVTPELFYGTYVLGGADNGADKALDHSGQRLTLQPGLEDCLSVFGAIDRFDANTAQPAVLAAIGLSPEAISALVVSRRRVPIGEQQLPELLQSVGAATAPLRVGGNSIFTMRATARLRLQNGQLSDLKRTVAALVKYMPVGYDAPIHILRWYDMAWSY